MGIFDFFSRKDELDDLSIIRKNYLLPLKGYIEKGQYDEALKALQTVLVKMMMQIESNIKSNPQYQYREEVESIFYGTVSSWYAQALYSVITDIKELGNIIDVDKNMKCALYAACELFNSFSPSTKVPLYFRDFAKENSII